METSIEIGRHTEPHCRSSQEQGESTWSNQAIESAGARVGLRAEDDRVSVDPMRATDRYRLVMPCDLDL